MYAKKKKKATISLWELSTITYALCYGKHMHNKQCRQVLCTAQHLTGVLKPLLSVLTTDKLQPKTVASWSIHLVPYVHHITYVTLVWGVLGKEWKSLWHFLQLVFDSFSWWLIRLCSFWSGIVSLLQAVGAWRYPLSLLGSQQILHGLLSFLPKAFLWVWNVVCW